MFFVFGKNRRLEKTWLTDIWYHVIHSDFELSIEIVDTSSRFWNDVVYNDSKT